MKITIPTDLKEITCLQFHKLQEAIQTIESEPLLKITLISNICNVSIKDIVKFKMSDINDIYNEIEKLLLQQPKIEHFTIDGVKYGFIPDLEAMSGAEFIDAESYADTDIFKFMAVMYRPITKEVDNLYKIEKYKGSDKYEKIMHKAPASAYVAVKVFFSNLQSELLTVIPAYTLKNLPSSVLQILEKNGVGTFPSMN